MGRAVCRVAECLTALAFVVCQTLKRASSDEKHFVEGALLFARKVVEAADVGWEVQFSKVPEAEGTH